MIDDIKPSVEPLSYPTSFFFFTHVLNQPVSFAFVPYLIQAFNFLQQFTITFTPCLIRQIIDQKDTIISKFIFSILRFSPNAPKFTHIELLSIILFLVLLSIISVTFLMLFSYKKGVKIATIILRLRGMNILYNPSVFIYFGLCEFCFAVSFFSQGGNNNYYIIRNCLFSVLIIIFDLSYYWWISPLVTQTPMLASTNVPSSLIPNHIFFVFQIIDIILVTICVIGQTTLSSLFYIICSALFGLYKIYYFWCNPFMSRFANVSSISIAMSAIINPILSYIHVYIEGFTDSILLGSGIGLYIIFFIIVWFVLARRKNRVLQNIIDDEVDFTHNAIYATQLSIQTSNITTSLHTILEEKYVETGNIDYLLSIIYYEIIFPNGNDCEWAVSVILRRSSYSRLKKFIVFELVQSLHSRDISISGFEKIEKGTSENMKLSDSFWTHMMLGKVENAYDELKRIRSSLNDLLRIFSAFQSFSPHNPAIKSYDHEFFKFFKDGINQDPPLRARHSQYINQQLIEIQSIYEDSSTSVSDAKSADRKQSDRIRDNLHSFFKKELPNQYFLYIILCLFSFIIFIIALSFPNFKMMKVVSDFSTLPTSLNLTVQIALGWSKIDFSMAHLSKCTAFLNQTCQDILPSINGHEPDGVQCLTVINTTNELREIAENVYNDMHTLIRSSSVNKFWYEPKIDLQLDNHSLDIKSLIIQYLTKLLISEDDNFTCSSQVIKHFSTEKFFTISADIMDEIKQTLDVYSNQIENERINNSKHNNSEISLMIIFGIISIIFPFICTLLCEKYFYTVLVEHFRPKVHPNNQKIVERSDEIEKFKFPYHMIWYIAIVSVYLGIYLGQYFIFWHFIQKDFDTFLNQCHALVAVENMSVSTSIVMNSLFRAWQFPWTESILLKNMREYFNIHELLLESISPIKFNSDPNTNNDFDFLYQEYCDPSDLTFHDMYSCWPITRQILLFALFILETAHNDDIDIYDISTRHVLHIFITHITASLGKMGNILTDNALITDDKIIMLCIFETIIFVVFLLVGTAVIIYQFMYYSSLYQNLYSLLYRLSPRYIASENSLMTLLIPTPNNPTIETPLFSMFEKVGIPLLLVNEQLRIVTFTEQIQQIFSYRAEQLMGQSLEVLIPKKMDKRNEIKFYHQISLMLKRQAENNFSKTLIGRMSDGNDVQLQVTVNLIENDYFIVECQSLADIFWYEELTLTYTDIFAEMILKSMPNLMLNESLFEGNTSKRRFEKCLLLYVLASESSHRDIVENLSGQDGSCVLLNTGNQALVLFFGDNGRENCWNFFRDFKDDEIEWKSGIILEVERADMILFPPPTIPSEYEIAEMPLELMKNQILSMTIEPMIPELNMLPKLVRYLKSNTLITSSDFADYLGSEQFSILKIEHEGNFKICDLHAFSECYKNCY